MAPHHCRICSAAMSADDEHRECPDCLGAVQVLEDVDNPCSAAVDLSRGEGLRRANQMRGHMQEGRAERRRSPRLSPRSCKRGHKHTRIQKIGSMSLPPPPPRLRQQGAVVQSHVISSQSSKQ
ncbi:unnamed protein product [Gadus morhua 'NCC']